MCVSVCAVLRRPSDCWTAKVKGQRAGPTQVALRVCVCVTSWGDMVNGGSNYDSLKVVKCLVL